MKSTDSMKIGIAVLITALDSVVQNTISAKLVKSSTIFPKYGVTDYEMEEAANKECMYGVWDRETNNY